MILILLASHTHHIMETLMMMTEEL